MRTVLVAAGVVVEDKRLLVSRRKAGTHLGGMWEFPGGKVEPGEDPRDALTRELAEELGVVARVGEIVDVTFHRYADADKSVLLLFFDAILDERSPRPRALDVAEVSWLPAHELEPASFPPADREVLRKIRERIA